MHSEVAGTQLIFLFLLLVVALVAPVARRVNVPYPILLVLAGLVVSFVPHVPRVRLDPDLVFLIFLPPLLYAAAWMTNWSGFRRSLLSICMLAIGLVAFTVWGVAEVADRFITALDWKSGFVLGAVVATTDAIAATAIAKSIGLPQRIVDLLEGESLVNDATGLLALEFGLRMLVQGDAPSPGAALLRLAWLVAAGLGTGLAIGVLTAWIERWIDDGPVEMIISLVVPYVAYLAAEELRASGVLAVVAAGLYLSRRSMGLFSPSVRVQMISTWEALNFILNGLVFLLIGLQLPYVLGGIRGYSAGTLVTYGAVFSAVLILLRLAWMYPGAAISAALRSLVLRRRIALPAPREVFVVGWTGMRGVVSLAAALSLPETLSNGRPFAQRNLILFLTFSIILVTLVVQGLSLPALIRALGLAGKAGSSHEEESRRIRALLLGEGIAYIEEHMRGEQAPARIHEELLRRYRQRLALVSAQAESDDSAPVQVEHLREVAREVAHVERRALIRMRDAGDISDELARALEHELDLREIWQAAL